LGHTPPPLPSDIPAVQQFAATSVHVGLYVLLIVQPIVGWIGTSAFRAPILVFWLFELPPIWPQDRAFSDQVFVVHRAIGFLIVLLLAAHIGAALFHHFVRRDGVLLRMWSLSKS
jgi:cytochrome b561